MYASVCMLCMICMILTGLLWSRVMITTRSVRMMVLYVLAYLSIGCFKFGTSDVRASHVVPFIDDQAKGWRPWLDDWNNNSWMMNCCLLLVFHFFCPQNSFVDSHVSMAWWLRFFSLWVQTHCFLQIARRATLCPHFLIIFFHRDSDTKIITIYGEQGKFHSSSFFLQVYNQNLLFIIFPFLCLYFCLSCPFGFST